LPAIDACSHLCTPLRNSQRLARLENTFDGLSEQLASNEAVLNEVAQSLKTNLETLQANIQSVEQRVNSASK
jgi:hypothetical protein